MHNAFVRVSTLRERGMQPGRHDFSLTKSVLRARPLLARRVWVAHRMQVLYGVIFRNLLLAYFPHQCS